MTDARWAYRPDLLAQYARQGITTAAALIATGLDSRTVYRRCLPGGPWQRLLPGIILLNSSPPSDDQRVVAALAYGGPNTVVTGLEACRRHGFRQTELPPDTGVHLLIPHTQRRKSCEFVTIERSERMPLAIVRDGVPLAPAVRATLDAARRIRATEPVSKLLIEAVQRGRCSPAALAEELELGSPRGTALPRRLLVEVDRLKSVAELHGRRLAGRLDPPPSHWNVDVLGRGRQYVGCPDFWWDDVAMAWEIDSRDWHYSPEGYARTLERNTRYAAAGIVVVQTLPSRLLRNPDGVLADLAAAYAAASARPRPAVFLRARAA